MSALQRFTFHDTGQTIRTAIVDGEPWFVAADVCAVLKHSNHRIAVGRLPDRMKGVTDVYTPGGNQRMTIISEPGVYRLVMRSNVPAAEAFQDWLAEEVIPACRRTGSYALADAAPVPMSYPDALRELAATVEQRDAERARAAELEPDAERARQTIDATGLSNVSTVAKMFGMREKSLREFLWAEDILISTGRRKNEPKAKWMGRGYFEVKKFTITRTVGTESRSVTYITPKGEAMIWHRLYGAGLVSRPTPPPAQPGLFDGFGAAA